MDDLDQLMGGAVEAHQSGDLARAETQYRAVLQRSPDHADALHLLGVLTFQKGQPGPAADLIRRAIAVHATEAGYHANLGLVLNATGALPESAQAFAEAARLAPSDPQAQNNLGNALDLLGRNDEAQAAFERAIRLAPDYAEAHNNLGILLGRLGRNDEALQRFNRAVALRRDYPEAHSNLGAVLTKRAAFAEAEKAFQAALKLRPDYAEAHYNRGEAFREAGDYDRALDAYAAAIKFHPHYAEAFIGRGVVFLEIGRPADARADFLKALELGGPKAELYLSLGDANAELGEAERAAAAYREAVQAKPDLAEAHAALLHQRMHLADWTDFDAATQRVAAFVARDEYIGSPFPLLALPVEKGLEIKAARRCWTTRNGAIVPLEKRSGRQPPRLHIAYLSADFREHAVARLMVELTEKHDRSRFQIYGYSYGADDGGAMRGRLTKGFDHFVDIRAASFVDTARRIRDHGVAIVLDLMGYTRDARPAILAYRAAPVQVNYLGYPGTMGASAYDYIVVDDAIAPQGAVPQFSEQPVYLPDCYQPNDRKRPIAPATPSREQAGLPAAGFVFCSFNNTYKITPVLFARWMNLLRDVPGSVLWLLEASRTATDNLRRHAQTHGIAPERLVFAPRCPIDQHLARHRLADLFLDTFPYGSHTTGSDTLWAGLPMVACAGDSFASRVSGSLLRAAGLKELITGSLDEYEALARRLATAPDALRALRDRLAATRETCALFDSERYTRNLERAFELMWERHQAGERPASIRV